MKKSRNANRFSKGLRLASMGAVAGLVPAFTQIAKGQLVYDSLDNGQNAYSAVNSDGSGLAGFETLGSPMTLAPGTTAITGFDFTVLDAATDASGNYYNFTNVTATFTFYGSTNTNGAPFFTNQLASYNVSLGSFYNSSQGGYYYVYETGDGVTPVIALTTPISVAGLGGTIGVTESIMANTSSSSPLQFYPNLCPLVTADAPNSVGTAPGYWFFDADSSADGPNFTSDDDGPYSFGLQDESLGFNLYGTGGTSTYYWNNLSGGNWETGANWSAGAPPVSSGNAVFNLSSPAPGYTVSINAADVCGNLLIQNDNVTISIANPFASLTVTNQLSVGNGSIGSLTLVNNNGSASNPANVSAGSILVGSNGGTGLLVVGSTVNLVTTGGVSIGAGSALNIAGGKLYTPSLSLAGTTGAWTGKLDIGTGSLDLSTASLATVTNQAKQGYNRGTWNASGGITSTAAATDTLHLTAVGVISNNVSGSALYGSSTTLGLFEGLSPGLNDVLVKYTYYGDCNLDGQVDGTDYSIIDHTYLAERNAKGVFTTPISGWYNGDFNYDGVVNGSDYTLMDNAFNQQAGSLGPDILPSLSTGLSPVSLPGTDVKTLSSGSEAAYGGTISQLDTQVGSPTAIVASGPAVPEPTSLGLLAIGAVGMLSRRSRKI